MKEAIAFYEWLETHSIRKKFATEIWYRITNDPTHWPLNLGTVTSEELWNKFKEDERNIRTSN